MDMGDHERIIGPIQHDLDCLMSQVDELPRGGYSRQSQRSRQLLARHGHTAQFLLPALDCLGEHVLPTLVDEGGIAQRSWKGHHRPRSFGTRSRSRVEYDNWDGLVARVRYGEGSARIRCSHQVLQRLSKHTFSNLLALRKTHAVLTMYLVDTTAANAVMGVVLQEILPGQPHQALRIGSTQFPGPGRQRFYPALQQVLCQGILLLDPYARRKDRRQQVSILAAAHLPSECLQGRGSPLLARNVLANNRDVLWQRAYAQVNTIILGDIAILPGKARDQLLVLRIDVSQQGVRGRDHGRQAILRVLVIRAIHEQERAGGSLAQQVSSEQFDACDEFFQHQRHDTGIRVAASIGEVNHQDTRAIWRSPVKLAFMGFRANAAPEDRAVNIKAAQNLWQLRNVAEAIGHIANTHGFAELGGSLQADLQITYKRFATNKKLVGLQVPRTDHHAPGVCIAFQALLLLRPDLQVIVQHNGLTI